MINRREFMDPRSYAEATGSDAGGKSTSSASITSVIDDATDDATDAAKEAAKSAGSTSSGPSPLVLGGAAVAALVILWVVL